VCVCILALLTQHASHIASAPRYIAVCSLSCSVILSPYYLLNSTILCGGGGGVHQLWFSLQLLSETILTIQQDIINIHWSSCKVPIIPAIFKSDLNFLNSLLTDFQKILKYHEKSPSGSQAVPYTDRLTWQRYRSLFALLQTHLKIWRQIGVVCEALTMVKPDIAHPVITGLCSSIHSLPAT
jgi:hypothetical protein